MIVGNGRPVFSGIAIGRAYVYRKGLATLPASCGDPAAEQQKFEAAKQTALEQLQTLMEETAQRLGEEQAMILDVQMMMLDDQDYLDSIAAMIQNGASAAEAVKESGDTFSAAFAAMDDAYMQARAVDVRDVSHRVVTILCGGKVGFAMEEPGILIAEDLTPSETVQMPKDKILAFVTRQGSSNSHTAILARIMGIPSLVKTQINLDDAVDGHPMIVDGFDGRYYIDPDEEVVRLMRENFAPVSSPDQLLFQKEHYHRQINERKEVTVTYTGSCRMTQPYDRALFNALRGRIETIGSRVEANALRRLSE